MTENYDVEVAAHPIKMWTRAVPIEEAARVQLRNLASLPFIYKHVAVMPDVHLGKGATVGSVIATKGAIVPAAVGVDIGCGMIAAKLTLEASELPDNLRGVRDAIEAVVPVGMASHRELPKASDRAWYGLKERYRVIESANPKFAPKDSPALQIGTLGGGNHFIELCLDEADTVWVMLHSGSRNIGNRIGNFFISRAREEMERMFIHLPDKDLAYLAEGTESFNEYVEAVSWAQDYAAENRRVMLSSVVNAIQRELDREDIAVRTAAISCHHNYVSREHHFGSNVWVTRKGAVRARAGELGIIPGSMGTRSYVVEGLGNPESFESCSHGAGRRMSRAEAKRTFTLEDHARATSGVECRKDSGVIDETPGAYKDLDAVMEAQKDLVRVKHTLKQVLCVKG
jgi:tRNA-splicing ligase RtcB